MTDLIARQIEHRRLNEVHECIRPGCGARACVAYHVDQQMRLAGRDLAPGEFVDLCAEHDYELYRAANDAVIEGYPPAPDSGGPVPQGNPFIGLSDDYDELPTRRDPLEHFREWPEDF